MKANLSQQSFDRDDDLRELIISARDGDKESTGEILERYRNYLREVARRKMASPLQRRFDASDMVQDALLEAHQGIESLLSKDEAHLRACLRQILRCNIANVIRDHLHTARRDATREQPIAEGFDQSADNTSPSLKLHRQDAVEHFLSKLGELPEDESTVVQMRYFENASVSEIAESVGRSRGATASLLKRALARLRNSVPHDSEWK